MGIPVLILGETGTGKSTSMRNFDSGQLGIFNVASKPLPFRKKMTNKIDGATYKKIAESLGKAKLKSYVIDDSQYLLAFEFFDKVNIKGYDKFTELAVNFKNLIDFVIRGTPSDVIVYFLHHTETTEHGTVKAKTIGKMLDQQLTVEGMFAIVLRTSVENGVYKFITQNSGADTCKSPMEMFDMEIDNDLKFVDDTIRSYYGLGGKENEATS